MISPNSMNSVTKKIIVKRLFNPITSCVRDPDVTTQPARHG